MPLWQIRSYRIPEIRDPRTTPYPELYQAYFRPRAFQSEFSQGRAGVQMDRLLFIESLVSSGRDCRSSCPFLIFGLLLLYSNMASMKFPVSQSLELKLFLRGSRFSILSRRRGDWWVIKAIYCWTRYLHTAPPRRARGKFSNSIKVLASRLATII